MDKDYIGLDPSQWIRRLRDVNETSLFKAQEKTIIEAGLIKILAELEKSKA